MRGAQWIADAVGTTLQMLWNKWWVSGLVGLGLCAGCVVSESSLGVTAGDGPAVPASDDGGQESGGSSTGEAATDSLGGTGWQQTTGEETTGSSATSDEGGPVTDDGGGTGSSSVCAGLDHTCYADIIETCDDTAEVLPACEAAMNACYPLGPEAVNAHHLFGLCEAELEEGCLGSTDPACGENFCACVAGVYPFDWTNCFHLVSTACVWSTDGNDCQGAVDQCYPGATVDEVLACHDTVNQKVCNCPMCGEEEACGEQLAACLGA